MNVDETQRKKVAGWIAEGLKLSEIQNRLASELGVRMTYMDVRLLVDDLKLTPKDAEPQKAPTSHLQAVPPNPPVGPRAAKPSSPPGVAPADAPAGAVGPSVTVDRIARPGAVVSGKVTFGDGNKADWHLDETGRLGMVPEQQGYRPPPAEVQQFQAALENELRKMGL